MAKHWRRLSWNLVILGLLCLSPAAYMGVASKPTTNELSHALSPIVRIPLDGLRASGSAGIIFDASPPIRVSRHWGDPFYTVFWRTHRVNGWWVHSFSALRIKVKVSASVPLDKLARFPYGHSSDTEETGLRFVAKRGDEVRIDLFASDPTSLPEGELVVAPDWNVPIKDKLVVASLEDDLRRIARVRAWVGLALAAVGLIVISGTMIRAA